MLARSTQRPFLNARDADVIDEQEQPRITFYIQNTGNLPADDIKASCAIDKIGGTNPQQLKDMQNETESLVEILFPSDDIRLQFTLRDHRGICREEEGFKFRLRIDYTNKITNTPCYSIRNYICPMLSLRSTDRLSRKASPRPREDKWK